MSLFGFSGDSSTFTGADRAQLIRIEQKLDLILQHLGLALPEQTPSGLSPEVQALCRDPNNKIQAIARYRQETGCSLVEAKAAVERFMTYGM